MSTTAAAATLAPMAQMEQSDVPGESRGAAINRRMRALGMNFTSLGKEARGTYRQTVKRATEDNPTVEPGTYDILEATLDRLERQLGHAGGPDAVLSTEERLIEFEVSSDAGVRVVVRGPVTDAAALEAAVANLIRDMGGKRPSGEQ